MSPIPAIRKKAFEEEITYITKEFFKIYSFPDSIALFSQRLDKYLDKHFSNYIKWFYKIDDNNIITWNISGICDIEFSTFTIDLKDKNEG